MIPMTFSINKPRKIGHPNHSNNTFSSNKSDLIDGPVTSIPTQSSQLYSFSVRASMLGHLLPANGCTDCPKSK